MHLIEDISYRKPNITKLVIENNKGLGKVLISKDSGQKLVHFFAGLYLKFNLGKSRCFKVISQACLDNAKLWKKASSNSLVYNRLKFPFMIFVFQSFSNQFNVGQVFERA